MKNQIIGWSIVAAALAGIGLFVVAMVMWVNAIITAPTCAGSDQPVCKVKPVEQPKVIQLPDATEIENRVNAYRSEKGLSILTDSSALDAAAEARATQMCAENDWSHEKDWWVLSQHYNYQYAGENLYYGTLTDEQARKAVRDWVASPTHLQNIVGNYTEIGIAVKSCPGFQGEPKAVIITNYFGVPR